MASAVAELEAGLQAMLSLKPPGVSGSRIQGLTALCTANIQSESVLIQKLFTHFKKAPGSHKLGVLYVVDSVTRKWTEQAKANAQPISSSAQDGTFAAGVHRVTELLPVLMNDITQSAPDDQKEKIKKLVEIWEKGQTFPLRMLTAFKEKLNEPQTNSTTPDGSPPRDIQPSLGMQANAPAPPPASNTSSILEALANMARQNTSASAANPNVSAPDNSYKMPGAESNPAQQVAMNPTYPFPTSAQPVNVPAPSAPFPSHTPATSNGIQNYLSNPSMPFGGVLAPVSQGPVDPAVHSQIMLLKTLADNKVPQEQWGAIIAALTAAGGNGAPSNGSIGGMGAVATPPFPGNQGQNQGGWGVKPEESRDRSGFLDSIRSPDSRYRRRSRSISPARGWGARDSPSSHRDQGYDEYGRHSPSRGRPDDHGRNRGNDYRQRSPANRRGRSPSPSRHVNSINAARGEKWVEYDPSIGSGNVKVLSRTLFVGGVTCTERELREIFNRFGRVQTCIVNKDKRHAFVKMISRHDAVTAKEAMEGNRTPDSQMRVRSTRWGVGFGPRDCCDYQTGVSIIPIGKLTDADRKWMLTAEYGGSGGKSIEGGMVVEEPDIEIGQGVSSKAISRRMQTDRGGNNGPKSGREREDEESSRFRRPDGRRDDDRFDRGPDRASDRDRAAVAGQGIPSSIPGFPGFPLPTLPNGMPMFPPGFTFPAQSSAMQQPPPPGRY
ncbi:MAG: hypothetical protein M1818_003988 [Claussenomyces sp. TS43310]|nr:MAG: hypothetical protein M1818_003988 [Claussenomyces sp. TS43310]